MQGEPNAKAAEQIGREVMAPRGVWPPFAWNPAELDNPLIGRTEALADLDAAFDAVVSHWMARVHLLVSDYGLGKSRVLATFAESARAREPDTLVVRIACPGHGADGGGAFRMWSTAVRTLCEVPADTTPEEARRLVAQGVGRWLTPESAALVARLIEVGPATRLSVVEEETLIARMSAALVRLFEGVAFERPFLLVVDDADRGSARDFTLATALATALKGRPVMVLLVGATHLVDHLAGWDRFPVTRLGALSRPDAERMLRLYMTGLVRSPSRELVDRLLDTAAGNSYALKALVRWLVEAGGIVEVEAGRWQLLEEVIATLSVPDTLKGVIHARLAALEPAERELVAQAALIGREFWLGALVTVQRMAVEALPQGVALVASFSIDDDIVRIREVLEKLTIHRFIETRVSRFGGEPCFGFRSSVHAEAALAGIPQTTRQRWHQAVLAWLELKVEALERGGTRGLFVEELARHAEGAGSWALAVRYHVRAAELALGEGHSRAALTALHEALRLLQPEQTALRLKILSDLGGVHADAGAADEAVSAFEQALALTWRLGDRAATAAILTRLADAQVGRGRFEEARQALLMALRLREALRDTRDLAAGCIELGRLHWTLGEFDQALRVYGKAEHLYRKVGDDAGVAETLHVQGAVHYDRGDVALSERFYEEALVLRRRAGDRRGLVRTLNNLGAVWMGQRVERSVRVWQEAAEVARELGDLRLQASLADNLGEALTLLGRRAEAREALSLAVELAELTGRKATLVDSLRNLALLDGAEGAWEAATEGLKRAEQEAKVLGLVRLLALVERAVGDLALMQLEATGALGEPGEGHGARAEAAYLEAAAAFDQAGYGGEAASSFERLAELLALTGREKEASEMRGRADTLRRRHAHPTSPPPVPSPG